MSSGDGCDPYSDDEDCFDDGKKNDVHNDDDDEGSGSGDGGNNAHDDDDDDVENRKRKPGGGNAKPNSNKSSSNGKSGDDPDDEEIENWPPWVTAKPVGVGDKDIVVEEGRDDTKVRVKSASPPSHFTSAVIYYLVPMTTCLIGSILSW